MASPAPATITNSTSASSWQHPPSLHAASSNSASFVSSASSTTSSSHPLSENPAPLPHPDALILHSPSHHIRYCSASSNELSPAHSSSIAARRDINARSLTLFFGPCAEQIMSLDDMPDSPPDLSSSRSSANSDSLHSASSTNTCDDFTDINHFEDISLADVAQTAPTATRPARVTGKPRPLIKTLQTMPAPLRSPRYNPSASHSRNSLRLSPINGRRMARSASRSPISTPTSTGAGSPSLNIPSPNVGRSPTSRDRRKLPSSPRFPFSSDAAIDAYRTPRRRDPSRQGKRKTAKEIEDDYEKDDQDDDLPDDFVIANIPLSPRPPSQTASSSKNTSPERPQSSCSSDSHSRSVVTDHRAKSWDAAMLGLTMDVRELSSKLDLHNAEEYKRHSDPQRSRPAMNLRSVTLPPIQRGNAVIDPLPCSKEKEKYLSRTRPGWLPPKSKSEEKRHLEQYKQIMSEFFAAEKRKSQEQEVLVKTREQLDASARRTWEMHILPQWDMAMASGKARQLWWQGIPADLRGKVWVRAIGNDLHLSHGSFEAALARAKALQQRLATSQSTSVDLSDAEISSNARSRRSMTAQASDIDTAFPEHKLFQAKQTFHLRLRDVLAAYSAYRSDTGHVIGTAGIAALLLVHIPEPGRCFVALANLLNRPMSLAFCLNDASAKDRTFGHILRGMKHKVPYLHEHLINKLGLRPDAFLGLMCRGLLTSHLEMAEAARVLDILVFEGDGVLVRAVIAYFAKNEASLYGDQNDVLNLTSMTPSGRGGVSASCASDGIIDWVKWAGKEEADRPEP